MAAVAKGGDRQDLHERIRRHSIAAATQLKGGQLHNPLIDLLRGDDAFAGLDWSNSLDPAKFVGRAPQQVEEFLDDVVKPIREKYFERLNQTATVDV